MSDALKNYVASTRNTPQMERTPGRTDEVVNNAGGFVFKVSDKTRLERFLILGTDGGTYYVSEAKLTADNATFVIDLIGRDEPLVREVLRDIAVKNRAPKNDASIFTLALLLVYGKDKAASRAIVNDVVRTSTHLFDFTNYLKSLGGMGRAKRSAVADWYTSKDTDQLAYQSVKYRQRNGMTHRDAFRISHPKGVDSAVGEFILSGRTDLDAPRIIDGYLRMQECKTIESVLATLNSFKNLPWETIPTEFLTDPRVWKALFYNGALGQTALLRNVTRFAKIGAFDDLVFVSDVADALADRDRIIKGRVHPVAYANALGVYRNGPMDRRGYGERLAKTWVAKGRVVDGIEAGFYESFATITPANKPTMLALDVSASMTWEAPAGLVGMDAREASAVMAMVSLRTEPYTLVTAFSSDYGWGVAGGRGIKEVDIAASDSLDTTIKKVSRMHAGGTDCALPMMWAEKQNIGIDTFIVYTDNDTWAGATKPNQALVNYRRSTGREARLAVVGMTATNFTIADTLDRGMLDCVGMDSTTPKVLADFSAGRI